MLVTDWLRRVKARLNAVRTGGDASHLSRKTIIAAYRRIIKQASLYNLLKESLGSVVFGVVSDILQDPVYQLLREGKVEHWKLSVSAYSAIIWTAIWFFFATVKTRLHIRKEAEALEKKLSFHLERSYPHVIELLDRVEDLLRSQGMAEFVEELDRSILPYLMLSVDHSSPRTSITLRRFHPDEAYINELYITQQAIYAVSVESIYGWIDPKFFFFLINNCVANLVKRVGSKSPPINLKTIGYTDPLFANYVNEYNNLLGDLSLGTIPSGSFHTIRFFIISRSWARNNVELLDILRYIHELFQCYCLFFDKDELPKALLQDPSYEKIMYILTEDPTTKWHIENRGFVDFILLCGCPGVGQNRVWTTAPEGRAESFSSASSNVPDALLRFVQLLASISTNPNIRINTSGLNQFNTMIVG